MKVPGKPKEVFDGVDTVLHFGTNNERRLNSKNRIALQIFITFDEQMSDDGAIARRADHEMNVRRPERMSSHRRQQLTGGTVIWDWITDRHDGSEPIGAYRICEKARSQMTLRLIAVLDVVQLVGSRLPDLYQRAGDRL